MQTPIHPMVVHLPIALAILMPLVAGGLALAIARGWARPRAWLAVVAGQALLLGSGFVALRTGEGDEERVERFVAEAVIEQHEATSEVFMLGAGVVFALTVLAMLLAKWPWSTWLRMLSTLGTLSVVLLGFRVGRSGGELVYVHGAAAAFAAPGGTAAPGVKLGTERDHDDR